MSNRTHPTDSTTTDADCENEWTVTLPDAVGSRIAHRLPNTEFDSVEAYVSYAMESLLRELDEQDAADGEHSTPVAHDDSDADEGDAPAEDDVSMEERLESLGYL